MEHYSIGAIEWLRGRLQYPLPGRPAQEKMIGHVFPAPPVAPAGARLSAVLCLLFPGENGLSVVLMKRREDHTAHSGQISFPGGKKEESDQDLMHTALRETEEELGIPASAVEVLGALTPLYIPVSNFHVFPYLGFMPAPPGITANKREVAYTLEIALADLFDARRKERRNVLSPAIKKIVPSVHAYVPDPTTIIWGATAMMLSELETLLGEYAASLSC